MSAASDGKVTDTARTLSAFAAGLTFDRLPADVVELGKMFIADYVAAIYAGIRINAGFNAAMLDITRNQSGGAEASVFGLDERLSAEAAAFMNAVYAHGADMDDGNRKAMGHVAAHVMSAVFALAEATGGHDWKDVMTAIIVGYEVYNRVAAMAQPGLVRRGFHSTGTAGAVACGAACAKLLGLDADGVYSAIGIAAIQASGLIIIAESGQALKPLNPANAARTGIVSAKLASKGVAGPALPLESQKGWLHAMTDAVHYEMLDGLGEAFTISESYLKPYPSCRHTHCGIDAAVRLHESVDPAEIEAINVHIYPNAIKLAGLRYPKDQDETKFSIPYTMACALLNGSYGIADMDPPRMTEEVKALIGKTNLIPDETMEDRARGIRGTRVEVVSRNGQTVAETVLVPKGDPENPLTRDDIVNKLRVCAQGQSSENNLMKLVQSIERIEGDSVFENPMKIIGAME